MSEPKWTGDLNDDCALKTEDGYQAHAEDMGEGEWYCQVTRAGASQPPFKGQYFHSTEHDIRPLTGEAARMLCKMVIDADRWRRIREL